MNYREINAFLATAEKGSFLKAAEELHTSAVSVMNQVNSLENFTGVKLIERTSRGAKLTPAGLSFRDDMKDIIALTESAIRKAQKISRSGGYTINIGTSLLRPCKPLTDILSEIDESLCRINIVPFDDSPSVLDNLLSYVDCFVSPCDSSEWQKKYNILILGTTPCRIAVPRGHRLAVKKILSWDDLSGEKLMLVKRGVSSVLDEMRDEIMTLHKDIKIVDIPVLYDTSIFNECVKNVCLMETPDIWSGIHPSLITVPMQWKYEMPFGIIYARDITQEFRKFIELIAETTHALK